MGHEEIEQMIKNKVVGFVTKVGQKHPVLARLAAFLWLLFVPITLPATTLVVTLQERQAEAKEMLIGIWNVIVNGVEKAE